MYIKILAKVNNIFDILIKILIIRPYTSAVDF